MGGDCGWVFIANWFDKEHLPSIDISQFWQLAIRVNYTICNYYNKNDKEKKIILASLSMKKILFTKEFILFVLISIVLINSYVSPYFFDLTNLVDILFI